LPVRHNGVVSLFAIFQKVEWMKGKPGKGAPASCPSGSFDNNFWLISSLDDNDKGTVQRGLLGNRHITSGIGRSMKILAGTQRKRKSPASFTVTPPETDAGLEPAAASSAAAALAKRGLLAKILWGLLLLSLAESMVLAGMVYRMPMQQFVDQTEAPPDPEQAQVILADQVNLLGLKDKSSPAVAVMPSYDIGPIHSPAVTRLEDADIPGLPANLAKQQQAATAGGHQVMPEVAPVAPPKAEHSDLPAPDQIPRAKMPVLDFHSILEQVLPTETKPSTPAHAPDKPAHTPPAATEQPRTAAPDQPGAKAILPEHPAATPMHPPAPIELYQPRGASAPDVLPPVGGMRITPHPAPTTRPAAPAPHIGAAATTPVETHAPPSAKAHAPSDAAVPTLPPAQPPAGQGQADATARHAVQAPHNTSRSDDLPLPPEAIAPRRHLPQSPDSGPALVDRPPVTAHPPVVPPPARLRPHIIVPVRPILPRPPIILDRPPGEMPERPVHRLPPGAHLMPPPGAQLMPPPGAHLVPPPGARLMPRAPDTDAPVEERRLPPRDRPVQQEDGPDAMPPPVADPAP
jgi:hypothetical protein